METATRYIELAGFVAIRLIVAIIAVLIIKLLGPEFLACMVI